MREIDKQREEWISSVIGHSEEDVRKATEEGGGTFFVAMRDGVPRLCICNVDVDRVNVVIVGGVVQDAWYG